MPGAYLRYLAATGGPEPGLARQARKKTEKSSAITPMELRFNTGVARKAMVLSEVFGPPVSKKRSHL